MFFDDDIKGRRVPEKTLCLTYDDGPGESPGSLDGPGPRTRLLGEFLRACGVRATFFVMGKHAAEFPETVAALHAMGHLIGNHTETHPGLVALAESGGDVVGEVSRAAERVRPFAGGGPVFFRAPYGNWRQTVAPENTEDRPSSVIAETLNASGRFPDHVGPVNWDIAAGDWDCWRQGLSGRECAERYLEDIETRLRGIVLMHDSSEEDHVRPRNRALEMARVLVPELFRRGYRFIGLDQVPQVRSATRVTTLAALGTPDGGALALEHRHSDVVILRERPDGWREAFGLVPVAAGRVALRARNGLYISAPSADPARTEVLAEGRSIGAAQTFVAEPSSDRLIFRSLADAYLTLDDDGRLTATQKRAAAVPLSLETRFGPRPL
jgi:peptidoglycan/xylan/chitin deacetylase (PgdA/CDA1 family)